MKLRVGGAKLRPMPKILGSCAKAAADHMMAEEVTAQWNASLA